MKSWLIGKDSDAGRDWGQEEKGTTEDEMAGWHHWLDGRESEWTPGVGDGQGGLACCNSLGRKESDMTERLISSDLKITADGDRGHEIKRCLLLGRKAMTNLDSILKSRDITSPTKVRLVKAMIFPVVMYGCEPVLLPGNSHGWKSLAGCSPWGPQESDTTERLYFHFSLSCIEEGNGNPLQ